MPADRPNDIRWQPWIVPNGGIDENHSDHELPPNKWAAAYDVEPLPTGCRNRFGKTAVNAIPVPDIAIDNVTGTNAREFSNGTDDWISQGITGVAATGLNNVTRISVRIAKKTGTPTSAVQLAIYDNAAGLPTTPVAGLDFADFNSVTAATINAAGGSYLWIDFVKTSGSFTIGNGNAQHLVLKSTGGGAGDNYQLQESTAGNPYAGGQLNFGSDGLAWTTVAAADIWFRIYAGGASINGILDYKLSDAVTERLLIAGGGEVYKEVSGVLTSVSGGDAGLMSENPDVHPAMNVGDDKAFISDGTNTPKKFFIRSSTEYWANDGISPPVANMTTGAVAGGSLPVDTYYFDYYYWDDLLQIASNTRYQGLDVATATTAGANLSVLITGLPSTVARVGDRATHIRISIRPSASGIFRFGGTAECQVALGTTTTTITALATTNEPDYDNDVAPVHSISVIGSNQRFISGMAATPWRVQASKISILGAFYESFPTENYRDFGKGDGDYVTAHAFIPPATLVVGMRNSVWALDARRFLTADPVNISKNVGIAGNASFMVVGRLLFFISDSDRVKGLMMWDGAKVTPLISIDRTFKELVPARIKYATCAHLAPGDGRFQWWTLITQTGTTQNLVICYDYTLDAFTFYRHSGNVLGTASKLGGLSKVKIGGADGILYDADTGTTDDGTEISAQFTTKRDDFGFPDAIKKIRFVRAEADAASDSHLTVRFEPDLSGFSSFSGNLDFETAAGSILGAGILGSFVLGSGTQVVSTREGIQGVCRNVQPTFFSSTRWTLRGYTIGAQVTRRRD